MLRRAIVTRFNSGGSIYEDRLLLNSFGLVGFHIDGNSCGEQTQYPARAKSSAHEPAFNRPINSFSADGSLVGRHGA